MNTRLITKTLAISAAAFVFAGSGVAPVAAQDEIKDAPLVENLGDLQKLDRELVKMAGPCSAATVSLMSRGGGGAGSGVIVSEDGLILTAAHVVAAMSDEIIVIFPDGKRKAAKPLGGDFDRDAAMVQITEKGSYPHVELGKRGGLRRNEWCVALGHPGGFDPARTPPVRLGRVLNMANFVVTDCAVVGGDSGGPLFTADGKLIGIHSNIGATLSENRHVPIDVYLDAWEDMKKGTRTGARFAAQGPPIDPERPVFGVNLGAPGEGGGVQVTGLMTGGPASKAGIEAGDVITKVNGDAVTGAGELIEAVSQFKVGDELKIDYLRGDEKKEVSLKLARLGDLVGDAERPRRPREGRRPRRERRAERPGGEEGGAKKELSEEEKEAKAKASEEYLDKLLQRALKEGKLELRPEDMEKLGDMAELGEMLERAAGKLSKEDRERLDGLRATGEPDSFFASTMKALEPVIAKTGGTTVQVIVDGKRAALGTVVSDKGWVLTKDTETRKGKVAVKAGKKNVEATLVKRFPKRDLALFEVKRDGLKPVVWAPERGELPVGRILTASGVTNDPLGIGLVSVLTRALAEVGFIGIRAGEAEGGVLVTETVGGGPARKAGLQRDDVITAIDGKAVGSAPEFGQLIRGYRAGDEVEVSYRRGEKKQKLSLKLAARDTPQASGRFRRMNEMSGPLSARAGGFPIALQHDIPLDPSECGGPLFDLNGRCVGINVSRAGRVKTLAIPVSDVKVLLAEANGQSSAKAKAGNSPEERAAVMKKLADVELELKAVERKLEELQAK